MSETLINIALICFIASIVVPVALFLLLFLASGIEAMMNS